ncbi:MAG TPA: adenylate/guanylate cyclase domain-containing protein [Spirochaetia bacterium]|nr:adenylate/guanylate cyclase domain-containing protein [Spirochaetia bacterium]
MSEIQPKGSSIDTAALRQEINKLKARQRDLEIMYENTVEHGTLIENELEERNQRINSLLALMKIYLPSQVFDSIETGKLTSKLTYKRQKLTMFFSDIVGFTEVTDTLEPEALSALLNEYLTEMSTIAGIYGGTVDKFIGDAIVVFFGDPQFIDDVTHAKRCVRMAVEMLEKTRLLSGKWVAAGASNGLAVRMGINTGYCTVGNFGSEARMDYTIIGGQVNIAARLEKIADRNSIFISEYTYALVKDIVEVEGPRLIEVRGIHYPLKVYKIVGIKTERGEQESHFVEFGNGFFLRQLYYEPDASTPADKASILEDLKRAVRFIEGK